MRIRQLHVKTLLLLICILASGLAACTQAAEAGPQTWIDFPLDGSHIPAGTPVTVISHAYNHDGVTEMLLLVDGIAYRRDVPAGMETSFVKAVQEWSPQRPGTYTLQVKALNSAGETISMDTITVRVTSQIAVLPIVESPREPGATRVPTEEIIPTLPPDPTVEIPATLSPTIDFWADAEYVDAGFCTWVHWRTQNVKAVFFNGDGVVGEGSRQTCPCEEETHTLTVILPDDTQTQRTVTIRVTGSCVTPTPTTKPPDTTPPPVPEPYVPADGLVLDCTSSQNLAWLPVQDDGGGPVKYDVVLQHELKAGQWETTGEWKGVTGKQVTAGKDEGIDCGPKYRWRVRAYDGAGNYSAWSAWSHFSISMD
ncbi:MAG: hypothetical protein AB8I69_16560 [Anaerolineae bacterium]